MKSHEELFEKYKCCNLMRELECAANYTRSGYMSKGYAEYYTWLALAAYSRIKELENKMKRKGNESK